MDLPLMLLNDRRMDAVARAVAATGGWVWVHNDSHRAARNTVLWFLDGVKPLISINARRMR